MHTAMRFTIRSIAATLAYALLLNQFAYAATPQDATNQAIVAQQQQVARLVTFQLPYFKFPNVSPIQQSQMALRAELSRPLCPTL